MSWFRDEKSVANRAQKVVSDMLVQLEKKNARIEKLEGVVLGLQEACVAPIEAEISRLEHRREVLLQELKDTDDMIKRQREILKSTRLEIRNQLENNENDKNSSGKPRGLFTDSEKKDASPELENDVKEKEIEVSHKDDVDVEDDDCSNDIDDIYDEECEMVDIIRQLEPQLLFILHRGNTDDIILYVPPTHRMNTSDSENDKNIIFLYRLQVYNDMDSAELISSFERQMGFGPKLVHNDERDDPSALEIPCKCFDDEANVGSLVGTFLYAIELPVLPNVVIDIWKVSSKSLSSSSNEAKNEKANGDKLFATTTIQGVKFVNLQRIFLMVETRWGLPTIVGIELSGRESTKGKLLVEVIPQ